MGVCHSLFCPWADRRACTPSTWRCRRRPCRKDRCANGFISRRPRRRETVRPRSTRIIGIKRSQIRHWRREYMCPMGSRPIGRRSRILRRAAARRRSSNSLRAWAAPARSRPRRHWSGAAHPSNHHRLFGFDALPLPSLSASVKRHPPCRFFLCGTLVIVLSIVKRLETHTESLGGRAFVAFVMIQRCENEAFLEVV